MKYDRIHEIETYLKTVKSATNVELMEHFDVSMQTLRRDLKELEEKQILRKVYGGVVLTMDEMKQNAILDVHLRTSTNYEAKQCIGRLAAECVNDNDIIFVDSGTTAYHMIPYLEAVKGVTIISHSLHVMFALRQMSNITTICLGGVYRPKTWTFHTDTTRHPYNYNKAFISTVGLSTTKGLTNTDVPEGIMKHHIMANANEVILLADHSKFGNVAFHHFGELHEINQIVTDKKPEDNFLKVLKKLEIKVLYE